MCSSNEGPHETTALGMFPHMCPEFHTYLEKKLFKASARLSGGRFWKFLRPVTFPVLSGFPGGDTGTLGLMKHAASTCDIKIFYCNISCHPGKQCTMHL